MTWRRNQQVTLAVTPKIASIFSFAGSTWIIVEVCTSKTKRSHPYHRLLLAMSLYDAIGSISFFMSTWPIPASQSNDQQVWTVGTTQTCSAQGFFVTLGVAVPIYNALLALYFLLVVNYNISDRTLRTRVEPAMHVTAFVWGFGTALSSTLLGLFNNANLWCWIAPYPSDCKDSRTYGDEGDCIRGDNAWIYRWAYYFAPLWFCILVASKYLCIIRLLKVPSVASIVGVPYLTRRFFFLSISYMYLPYVSERKDTGSTNATLPSTREDLRRSHE